MAAAVPERGFEVINAGGISYASYRIVPLIEQVLEYEPDLIVIYTGHNEFLEQRTYSGLLKQGRTLVTLRSFVENLAVYRCLQRMYLAVLPLPKHDASARTAPAEDGSTESPAVPADAEVSEKTLLSEEVSATLDWTGGLDLYHRNEEFTKGVLTHFEHNLQEMVDLCKQRKLPVILIEPAANLKDFSPFKSEPAGDLTASELASRQNTVQQISRLVAEGRHGEAFKLIVDLEKEDSQYAATYYLKGKVLLALGEKKAARTAFVHAKDLDVCPLRSISEIQRIVAEVAARNKVPFIPFDAILYRRLTTTFDKSGIPGNESFLDHVHPTIEMHQLLAKLIMNEIIRIKAIRVSVKLSDEDINDVFNKGVSSLDSRFMAMGDLNLAKVLSWSGKIGEARVALERAAKVLDTDPEVHEMLGNNYMDYNEPEKAIESYRKAVALSNNDPEMLFSLANAYDEAGAEHLAVKIYIDLIDKAVLGPEVHANRANIYLEEGLTADAEKVVRSGLKRFPNSEMLFAEYGAVLAALGRHKEAIPWLKSALKKQPDNAGILYDLAAVHALCGNNKDALTCLESAVRKKAMDPERLKYAKAFGSIRNSPEFQKILDRLK